MRSGFINITTLDSFLSCKQFLLETANYWAAINTNTDETEEDEEEEDGPEKSTTPRAPHQDPPGRLLGGDVKKHKLKAIVTGNKKYPSKPCRVCAAHKKRIHMLLLHCASTQRRMFRGIPYPETLLEYLVRTEIKF